MRSTDPAHHNSFIIFAVQSNPRSSSLCDSILPSSPLVIPFSYTSGWQTSHQLCEDWKRNSSRTGRWCQYHDSWLVAVIITGHTHASRHSVAVMSSELQLLPCSYMTAWKRWSLRYNIVTTWSQNLHLNSHKNVCIRSHICRHISELFTTFIRLHLLSSQITLYRIFTVTGTK